MDTTGRTTLQLTAVNLVDEFRDRELIVSHPRHIIQCVLPANHSIDNLDYPFSAGFTKPITITLAVFSVFAAAWLLGNIDVSIGSKKAI